MRRRVRGGLDGRELPSKLPAWAKAATRLLDDDGGRGSRDSRLVVDYFTCTCYSIPPALEQALRRGIDVLVLHLPAFWPMLDKCHARTRWTWVWRCQNNTVDMCHARLHDLVAKNLSHPQGAVHLFWTRLMELTAGRATRVIVVNAPTENIKSEFAKGKRAVVAANRRGES